MFLIFKGKVVSTIQIALLQLVQELFGIMFRIAVVAVFEIKRHRQVAVQEEHVEMR